MRRQTFFGLLSATLWCMGCGSGEAPVDAAATSSGAGGSTGSSGTGGQTGAGGGQMGTWPQFHDGPVAFSELLSGTTWTRAVVEPGARRMVSFPQGISSTLKHLLVTDLGGAEATVHSVAVQGTFPSGRIESWIYEPSLGAFVLILLSDQPTRVEVLTVKVDATTATVAKVAQSAVLDPKFLYSLAPTGSGGVVVVQGNTGIQRLTIQGTTGTWGAPTVQQGGIGGPFSVSIPSAVVADPAKGRLLAFGADVLDPVLNKFVYHAGLYEMVLAPPYAWKEIALGGKGPLDDVMGAGVYPGLVLDVAGNRAFVSALAKGTCPTMPCFELQGWKVDFAQNTWSALGASVGQQIPGATAAVDDGGRRTLALQSDAILTTSLADADLFKSSTLPLDGLLGPVDDSMPSSAILPDGRVITVGFTRRVLDLKAAAPRWDHFGTAAAPMAPPSGQLAVDADSGAVYTFSGAKNDLEVLAPDGASVKAIATTGAPPPRGGHGSLFLQKTLYLAGGSDASGAFLDDVWALDIGTSAWKKLATLPMGMTRVTLRVGQPGEILAMGYLQGNTYLSSPIVSIDVAKGTAHALAAKGDAPPKAFWAFAPLGTGFVGLEGGDVVGDTLPNRWTVVRDGDAMTWTRTPLVETGYVITGLVGVGAPDGTRAAFVGTRLFEAEIQSPGK